MLISHPSGMTPDEERFYTEDRLHLYVPKLGLDGNAHLSPPGKKKGSEGMARITVQLQCVSYVVASAACVIADK